jgi:type VI protein secretion system component VasK
MKSVFKAAIIILAFLGSLILTLLIFLLGAIWLSIPLYFLGLSKQLIILIICGVAGICWLIFVVWKTIEAIEEHKARNGVQE